MEAGFRETAGADILGSGTYGYDAIVVIAYHVMWTVYGRWLPNDPRGGSSARLRVPKLELLGPTLPGRPQVEPPLETVYRFYACAEPLLKWPIVELDGRLTYVAAEVFATTLRQNDLTCHACSIMTTHVHMVLRRAALRAEEMISVLQNDSRDPLRRATAAHAQHPIWGGPGWKVFLSTREGVLSKIRYVEENPLEAGQPRQSWAFVVPYVG